MIEILKEEMNKLGLEAARSRQSSVSWGQLGLQSQGYYKEKLIFKINK